MAANNEGAMTLPSAIYQEVKAWIVHQEEYEARHQTPAPLTDAQRIALEILRRPVTASPRASPPLPPPAPAHAPAFSNPPTVHDSDPNYIGILMEYHQKHNQLANLFFQEEPSGVLPGGVTGRICRVTISESFAHASGHIEHFPAVGFGLNPDGSEPRFTSKRNAKSFAAKCAAEWMAAQGLIRLPLSSPSPSPSPSSRTSTLLQRQGVSVAPSSNNLGGTNNAAMADGLPAAELFKLVNKLCSEMKIPGLRYSFVDSASGADTFDGRVDVDHYGDDELLSLVDASVVHGVQGKDNAKRAVAAKVLAKLQEIEASRDAQYRRICLGRS
ncbi:unnamed protein product [Discula destructiva]